MGSSSVPAQFEPLFAAVAEICGDEISIWESFLHLLIVSENVSARDSLEECSLAPLGPVGRRTLDRPRPAFVQYPSHSFRGPECCQEAQECKVCIPNTARHRGTAQTSNSYVLESNPPLPGGIFSSLRPKARAVIDVQNVQRGALKKYGSHPGSMSESSSRALTSVLTKTPTCVEIEEDSPACN